MKIKKVAALALAAVMGTSMLAGCASKSINEDAVVVTVSYTHLTLPTNREV